MKKLNHIRWIWNEWKHHKLFICLLVFLTVLSTSVAVIFPILFKELIDTIQNTLEKPDAENPMNPIYKIVWVMVAVGLIRVIASFYPGCRAYMNLLFEYILRKIFHHTGQRLRQV